MEREEIRTFIFKYPEIEFCLGSAGLFSYSALEKLLLESCNPIRAFPTGPGEGLRLQLYYYSLFFLSFLSDDSMSL